MDKSRLIALVVAFVAMVALVAGCGGGGGQKTQSIVSPYYGSINGVDTEPLNDQADIATDSWIHVYWPTAGFPPPREFTVRLQKEENPDDWGGVHIILRADYSDPNGGSWWFEPSNRFSTLTNYRIVITDVRTGDTAIAYFLTTNLVTASSQAVAPSAKSTNKRFRPKGAENAPAPTDPGAIEHRIKVNR